MLKAVQCDGCGQGMTVEKLPQEQQVACPSCKTLLIIHPSGIDKNTIIGDRYQIKQVIDESSVSVLYLAIDLDREDYVLVRLFSWDFSAAVSNQQDLLQTISSVSHLAEPIHVRIIDSGLDDSLIFTVWAYEDLESISSLVKRNGPLSPAMAVAICKDLALSLDKAFHTSGVGHYNISPACLFLNSQGGAKYSDFGISAQLSSDEAFMQAAIPYWSMSFMSPEMALGWNYPDIKSDMYSLAAVLYYMVTGTEPHAGAQSGQDINYDALRFPPSQESTFDREFLDLFYSMTARNPAQRYVSWSEAVSKMDLYLYEEKMKKSSYSQRHRASLTKTFDKDPFSNIEKPQKTSGKKKRSARPSSNSQKRMSADDVRRKLSHESDDAPVTFAKSGSARQSSGSTGKRAAIKKKKTSGGAQRRMNATTNNAPVSSRKSNKRVEEEAPKSKLSALLVIVGILFGVAIIYFVMKEALGSEKKPILATQAQQVEKEVSDQSWKDKLPPLPEPVVEVKPEPVVETPEAVVGVKPEAVAEVKPEPVVEEKEKSDRLRELLKKLYVSVPERGSDPVEVDGDLKEALKLAAGNEKLMAPLVKLNEEFAPKRALAVRSAFNDVNQQVRLFQFKQDFDSALSLIKDYNGPFAEEIKADLEKLKSSVLRIKSESGQEVDEPIEPEGAELKKKDDLDSNASLDELAEKIALGLTDAALSMIPLLQTKVDESINLESIKALLEKSSRQEILNTLTKAYQEEQQTEISLRAAGKKYTGNLAFVDDEVNSLRMSIMANGRESFKVVSIASILAEDNLPRLKGGNASQTAFLQMVYLRRAGQVTEALKVFSGYEGPLKLEISKGLKAGLDKRAAKRVQEILGSLGLPAISTPSFLTSLSKSALSPDNAWLGVYNLNAFKINFTNSDFFQVNKVAIDALGKKLSQLANKAARATVIVSDDGRTGTKTLDAALREAKSGEVIRVLPGSYEGTFDIRQKSVQLLGCSKVTIKSPLRVSEKGATIKGLTFALGDLTIAPEVSSVQISHCRFIKDGIIMSGENSSISINNCLIFGLSLNSNKRTSIRNTTIVDNAKDKSKEKHFAVKGFISGEIDNSVIYSAGSYGLQFKQNQKESTSFKNSVVFGASAPAFTTDQKERFSTEKEFKKNVGRASNVVFEKPSFIDEKKGDYRLQEFTPGYMQGEKKKTMGVQLDVKLNLMNVE
jgi:hypothetical protein